MVSQFLSNHFRFNIFLLPVSETGASSQYMNDYHKKPSIAVPNEAQYSNSDRNLSYVFDDHRLEQSREPKKTEKSTYYTKYNYDWNGPKVSFDRIISVERSYTFSHDCILYLWPQFLSPYTNSIFREEFAIQLMVCPVPLFVKRIDFGVNLLPLRVTTFVKQLNIREFILKKI